MGPQSFNCGNDCQHPAPTNRPLYRFNGAAVFQLRKPLAMFANQGFFAASMGPQSFNCGNASMRTTWPAPRELQWGRSLSTAETVAHRRRYNARAVLQWGRSLSTAETRVADTVSKAEIMSFNGAAVFQLRKPRRRRVQRNRIVSGFNGAAVFQLRKRPKCYCDDHGSRRTSARFNGAAVFQLRKTTGDRRTITTVVFNGAAVFRQRKRRCFRNTIAGETRFNGAAVFQLRKVCGGAFLRNVFIVARAQCFNGAAVFQLRKGFQSNIVQMD